MESVDRSGGQSGGRTVGPSVGRSAGRSVMSLGQLINEIQFANSRFS